jgi:hypothetical protein
MSVHKDDVIANTHGLNVLADGAVAPRVERIPLYEVYMRMAEELAKRSTCVRLQVGSVITDQRLENVLAIGYNGNARGLPNKCDSSVPGSCGCIHSEMNALVKAPGNVRDKVPSASPCVMCAVDHQFRRVPRVHRRRTAIRRGSKYWDRGCDPGVYDRWRKSAMRGRGRGKRKREGATWRMN